MWRGRKNLFIVINRAGKVTEKLGRGQRLAAYEPTDRLDVGSCIKCKLAPHKLQVERP